MIKILKRKIPGISYLVFILLAVIVTGYITPDNFRTDENIYLLIVTLEITAFVIPSIIYCHVKGFEYAKGLELKIPELNKIPVIISSLFALIAMNVLLNLALFKINPESFAGQGGITASGENINVLGVIISVAVIPAVCEEFVFRSVLFRDYNKYGALASIIITSIFFGIIHFDASRFIIYFVSGFMFGLTVYISRSVMCAMAVHALYNIYSIFFESLFWSSISRNVNLLLIIFIAFGILLASLLVLFSSGQRLFLDYSIMGITPPDGYERNSEDSENLGNLESEEGKKRPSILELVPELFICGVIFLVYIIIKG